MRNFLLLILFIAVVVVVGAFVFNKGETDVTLPADDNGDVFCTAQYDPVCGVDGKTYSNRCVAEQQNGVDVSYEGECGRRPVPEFVPPLVPQPNQSSNGVTVPSIPQPQPGPQTYRWNYNQGGFVPTTMEIRAGDTVIFMNQSDRGMWIASANHPAHGVYPESGGCIGSKFDACRIYDPSTSWSFTFNQKGTWNFHNHMFPSHTGAVVVK